MVLNFTALGFVARGAVWNDVRLADEPGRAHTERSENSLPQIIGIKTARYLVDDDAEQQVVGIAIVPFIAGLKFDWKSFNLVDQFIFRKVQAYVERSRGSCTLVRLILGKTRRM